MCYNFTVKGGSVEKLNSTVGVDDLSGDLQTRIASLETQADDRDKENKLTVPICIVLGIYAIYDLAAAAINGLML